MKNARFSASVLIFSTPFVLAQTPKIRAFHFEYAATVKDIPAGTHDENRLELSKDRDLILIPKQQADPLNYFVYPYAEIDGQPFANITSEVTYHDAEKALY